MIRLWPLLTSALILALVACGDDSREPDADASSTAPPDASPSVAATSTSAAAPDGDILVYTHEVRLEDGAGRAFPVLEVVAYDIEGRRELSAFEIGGVDAYPMQVIPAGERIVVNVESRIVSYDLDGSNERVLAEALPEGHFLGIGASHDGTMLAYTEQTGTWASAQRPDGAYVSPYPNVTDMVVVSLDDGSEIMRVHQSDPQFEAYRGQAAIVIWRDDNSGLTVDAYTYSEAPGGLATVMLDGSVTVHEKTGYTPVAPNGRLIADDDSQLCDLGSPPENHEIRIVDLDNGSTLASIRDDRTLLIREWSPASDELLIEAYALADTPDSECLQRDPASEPEWVLLPVDGSATRSVSGPAEARERWYEHALRYECDGEVRLFAYCEGANGVPGKVTVSIDGEMLAEVAEFQLVGFIEGG